MFCFQKFTGHTNLLNEFINESTHFLCPQKTKLITALHLHIQNSKIEKLKEIVDSDKANSQLVFNMRHPETKRTVLEEAALNGRTEIAKFLIEKGAKEMMPPNHSISSSALFFAVVHCHPDMVELLLKNGAPIESELGAANKSFLSSIVGMYFLTTTEKRKEYFECLVLLLRAWITQKGSAYVSNHPNAKSALRAAISSCFLEIAELLMNYGITSDLSEKQIEKAVHFAFYSKNLNLIKLLHERKICNFIDHLNADKRTILFDCAAFNATEILNYLIKIGVPTEQKDCIGETYAQYGARQFEFKILDSIEYHMNQSISVSMQMSHEYIIPLDECFKHSVELNRALNEDDKTLLYLACTEIFNENLNGSDGLIMQLLNHGADPYYSYINPVTPLGIAEETFERRYLAESPSNVERARTIIAKMKSMNENTE